MLKYEVVAGTDFFRLDSTPRGDSYVRWVVGKPDPANCNSPTSAFFQSRSSNVPVRISLRIHHKEATSGIAAPGAYGRWTQALALPNPIAQLGKFAVASLW